MAEKKKNGHERDQNGSLSGCVSPSALSAYLGGVDSFLVRRRVERHLAVCVSCREQAVFARESYEQWQRDMLVPNVRAKEALISTIQGRLHTGAARDPLQGEQKVWWARYGWFALFLFFFILSFLVKRYFVQCLVAAAIFGARWVMDSLGSRTLIMVYDLWKKSSDRSDGRSPGSRCEEEMHSSIRKEKKI